MFIPRTINSIFRPAIRANLITHRWTTTQVTRPQVEHRPTSVESASGAPGNIHTKRHAIELNILIWNTLVYIEELTTERSVRIFSPCKAATQQGVHGTRHWSIDFDIIPDAERYENPLIGWASR